MLGVYLWRQDGVLPGPWGNQVSGACKLAYVDIQQIFIVSTQGWAGKEGEVMGGEGACASNYTDLCGGHSPPLLSSYCVSAARHSSFTVAFQPSPIYYFSAFGGLLPRKCRCSPWQAVGLADDSRFLRGEQPFQRAGWGGS